MSDIETLHTLKDINRFQQGNKSLPAYSDFCFFAELRRKISSTHQSSNKVIVDCSLN